MTLGAILLFLKSLTTFDMPLLQLLISFTHRFNELWSMATTIYTAGEAIIFQSMSLISWIQFFLLTVLDDSRVRLIMHFTCFILAYVLLYLIIIARRLLHSLYVLIHFTVTVSFGVLRLCASIITGSVTVVNTIRIVASQLYSKEGYPVGTTTASAAT